MKKYTVVFILSIMGYSCDVTKLHVFDTYEKGKQAASEKNKSIFLIFDLYSNPTGYIDNLLADTDIEFHLKEYVVVRLMCDSNEKIDNEVTRGDVNSKFQVELTSAYFQPMFVKLSPSGLPTSEPMGYSKKSEVIQYIITK